MFYVLAACVGFFYASNFSLYPAEVARVWGTERMGAIYGVVFSAYAFAGLCGPTTAAWVFGRTGTYDVACVVAAVLCAAGAVVVGRTIRTGKATAVEEAKVVVRQ